MLLLIIHSYCFFSFGIYISFILYKRFNLMPIFAVPISAYAVSSLFMYVLFFVFLNNLTLGNYIYIVWLVLSFIFSILGIKYYFETKNKKPIKSSVLAPLALTLFVLLSYVIFLFTFAVPTKQGSYGELSNEAFPVISSLPSDNQLPFMYARNVLENKPEELIGDWKLVDRPPMQLAASIPLLYNLNFSDSFQPYLIFSILLQLSWIGSVWAFLKENKLDSPRTIASILAMSLTSFIYLNSIFVWPKLIAASLVVVSFMLMFNNKKINYRYLPVAAALISTGYLYHSGIVFTLIPMLAILFYYIFKQSGIKKTLGTLSVFLIIIFIIAAPWLVYKSSVSSSDRLFKWHFSGVISAEDNRSNTESLIQEYRKLTFSEWIDYRKKNIETYFDGNIKVNEISIQKIKNLEFFSSLFVYGSFIVLIPIVIYRLLKRRLDRVSLIIIITIVSSSIIWIFAMFLPNSTIVHQGSYANVLLGFLLLLTVLNSRKVAYLYSILFVQFLIFINLWLLPYF